MKTILFLCLMFLLLSNNANATTKIEAPYLFVISSQNGYIKGNKLFLNNINTNTIYFADKPDLIVGHMDTKKFLSTWDNTNQNNPNIVISFKNKSEDRYIDITLEISQPIISGRDIVFTITNILESSIKLEDNKKIKFNYPSLFIDGNGCWVFGC